MAKEFRNTTDWNDDNSLHKDLALSSVRSLSAGTSLSVKQRELASNGKRN